MPVLYGDFELKPTQTVRVSHQPRRTDGGLILGFTTVAVVSGTIVAEKPDGVLLTVPLESRLTTILARQKAIREAFREQGRTFQVQGWDGGVPLRFPASATSVEFEEGDWVNGCRYQVTVEGPEIPGEDAGSAYVRSCTESWSFEEDEQTWMTRVTHSVSAQGEPEYDGSGGIQKPAWEHARDFALTKLRLGWTAVGDAAWSPRSGESIAEGSAASLSGTAAWSPVVKEDLDEVAGSYSAVETFTLSSKPWWEEHRVVVRRADSEPGAATSVSISGVVHGMFQARGDFASKYANALAGWEEVRALAHARAQAAAGDPVLSSRPLDDAEVDHDSKAGTVSYTLNYNDRTIVNDTWESYEVSAKASHDDSKRAVSISGVIRGLADADEPTDLRLTRARLQWDRVKGLMHARAAQRSGVSGLKPFPTSAQVDEDADSGSISYQYAFDDRRSEDVDESRSVSERYSREEGVTVVAVEGQVRGLRKAVPGDPLAAPDADERFANAKAYFLGIEPNLLGFAALHLAVGDVNPVPVSKSRTFNDREGTVSYTYEFSTKRGPRTPGALSESINIRGNDPVPVYAEHVIPFRAEGPIFQAVGTKTAGEKEVSIEIVFPIGDPWAPNPPATPDLTPFRPPGTVVFESSKPWNWSPSTGRLSRSIAWRFVE